MVSDVFVFASAADVKSWLVMFGFQLSNIIPGFPRAKMYFVPPPYELSESQASENGQVRDKVGGRLLTRIPTAVFVPCHRQRHVGDGGLLGRGHRGWV